MTSGPGMAATEGAGPTWQRERVGRAAFCWLLAWNGPLWLGLRVRKEGNDLGHFATRACTAERRELGSRRREGVSPSGLAGLGLLLSFTEGCWACRVRRPS